MEISGTVLGELRKILEREGVTKRDDKRDAPSGPVTINAPNNSGSINVTVNLAVTFSLPSGERSPAGRSIMDRVGLRHGQRSPAVEAVLNALERGYKEPIILRNPSVRRADFSPIAQTSPLPDNADAGDFFLPPTPQVSADFLSCHPMKSPDVPQYPSCSDQVSPLSAPRMSPPLALPPTRQRFALPTSPSRGEDRAIAMRRESGSPPASGRG